jgi:restriction system protein
MVLRTAQKGNNAGKQFWGCSAYPDCRGAMEL